MDTWRSKLSMLLTALLVLALFAAAPATAQTIEERAVVERVGACMSIAEMLRALGRGDLTMVRRADTAAAVLARRLPPNDAREMQNTIAELRAKLADMPDILALDGGTAQDQADRRSMMIGAVVNQGVQGGCTEIEVPDWFRPG